MAHLILAVIYAAFAGCGLPDSLLGAAWPSMYTDLGAPMSYAGILSAIIAAGTVVSSLFSDRLTRKLGTCRFSAASLALTAVGLFGFSVSHSFAVLCLWAVPYGLGGGGIDASLNNYAATHYASCHMNWLHCMWGVGASFGPYVIGAALTAGRGWNTGYGVLSAVQIALTALVLLSLPLWKRQASREPSGGASTRPPLSLRQVLCIPGARASLLICFCYCAIEHTTSLWAGSYLVLHSGLSSEQAAGLSSLFFLSISSGRFLGGFLTMKLSDAHMIRLGQAFVASGALCLLLPLSETAAFSGLILIGLGCAPIYPCTVHATPGLFGAEQSQSIIGVQMASAYFGSCLMPPLCGLLFNHIGAVLFPLFLLAVLALMLVMHEQLQRQRPRLSSLSS